MSSSSDPPTTVWRLRPEPEYTIGRVPWGDPAAVPGRTAADCFGEPERTRPPQTAPFRAPAGRTVRTVRRGGGLAVAGQSSPRPFDRRLPPPGFLQSVRKRQKRSPARKCRGMRQPSDSPARAVFRFGRSARAPPSESCSGSAMPRHSRAGLLPAPPRRSRRKPGAASVRSPGLTETVRMMDEGGCVPYGGAEGRDFSDRLASNVSAPW